MGVFRQFPYSNFHEMNLDEIIKIVKNMLEEWAQYYDTWDDWKTQVTQEWEEMQSFINNYFDNLNVQTEINNKITAMVNSGEFSAIVDPYVPPATASWLAEHITQPVGVVIDTSLSVSGACADAKATGDGINILKDSFNFDNKLCYSPISENKAVNHNTGVIFNATDYNTSDYIPVTPDAIMYSNNLYMYAFYDGNKDYISGASILPFKFTVPSTAYYIRVSYYVPQSEDIYIGDAYDSFFTPPVHGFLKQSDIENDTLYTDGVMTSNLLRNDKLILNKYIDHNTGAVISGAGYYATNYIRVNVGDTIYGLNCYQGAFYDSKRTYISGFAYMPPTGITVPANAQSMRVTLLVATINSAYVGTEIPTNEFLLDFLPPKKVYNKQSNIYNDEKYVKGIETPNLLRANHVTNDKYINYNTGAVMSANGYKASDDILVVGETTLYAKNCDQGAFYDDAHHYISGFTSVPEAGLSIPNTAVYLRITIPPNSFDDAYVGFIQTSPSFIYPKTNYIPEMYELYEDVKGDIALLGGTYVTVGASGDYSTIIEALKNTSNKTKVYVNPGTYNIVSEYQNYYGNDFWSNYNGYSGETDDFYKGLWIDGGRTIEFSPNAKVVWDYNGSNSDVSTYFSPFATGMDASIIGLDITFNQYCRYAIHDDFGHGSGINTIKNCIFRPTSRTNGVTIGGGCNGVSTYIVENCVFIGASSQDISYHNSYSVGQNRIYVTSCKGDNTCYFGKYGQSTSNEKTYCIVSGSEFENITCTEHVPGANDNMALIEYNNTITA